MRWYVFTLSLLLAAMTYSLFTIRSPYWFYLGVVAAWLFFGALASFFDQESTLDLLRHKGLLFGRYYFILASFGFLIEMVGSWVLGWWHYAYLNFVVVFFSMPVFYPFILMSFRDSYVIMKYLVARSWRAVLLSMLLGILMWEVPNLFSGDWVYAPPFSSIALFGLPLVVLVGWALLIVGPVFLYEQVLKTRT